MSCLAPCLKPPAKIDAFLDLLRIWSQNLDGVVLIYLIEGYLSHWCGSGINQPEEMTHTYYSYRNQIPREFLHNGFVCFPPIQVYQGILWSTTSSSPNSLR